MFAVLLAAAVSTEFVFAETAADPGSRRILSRECKVMLSCLLSALSIVLFLKFKGTERKWCMFGMLLSTLGDIFMTDILGLGDISTYPGAAFFILAHIVYGMCFVRAGKRKNYKITNKGFWVGLLVTIAAALVLTGVMINATGSIQGMFVPILLYLAFIGFNLVSQFSYAYSEQGRRSWIALGMFLFIVSDFLVFLPMLNVCSGTPHFNDWIWFTYVPAQLLIVLFNS